MSARRPPRPEGRHSPRKPGIALLANADDEFEANLWEAILREEGIPSIVRTRIPGMYAGLRQPISPAGYDVFVPATALKRARALIFASSLKGANKREHVSGASRDFRTNVAVGWLLVALGSLVFVLFWAAVLLLFT